MDIKNHLFVIWWKWVSLFFFNFSFLCFLYSGELGPSWGCCKKKERKNKPKEMETIKKIRQDPVLLKKDLDSC